MPSPVPACRQHKPSGKAVVTLNGRDFYLGPWSSPESRQEYERLIAEWLANGRQLPQAVPFGELTVLELAAAYLDFAEATTFPMANRPRNTWPCGKRPGQ